LSLDKKTLSDDVDKYFTLVKEGNDENQLKVIGVAGLMSVI